MAITHVASASNSNAAGSTSGNLVVTKPTGTADGDVMLAFVYKALDGVHTLTAPAGWTQIGSARDATNIQASVWYKVASSEGANYTWTISAAGIWGVGISTFRGADTGAPINTSASTSGAAVDPYSCPNLTTTAESYVVSFGASRDDSTTEVTHTATDTELLDWGNDGGASTRNGAVYFSGVKSVGSVTGLSINPTGSITDYAAWSIALREPITGTAAATLPAVTSQFAGEREIPAGSIGATLAPVTSGFAGTHHVPATGTLAASIPAVTAAVEASVEPIGSVGASLAPVSATITGETRQFGEHIIVVEQDHRAFLVVDDGTDVGLKPIKRSRVTDQ